MRAYSSLRQLEEKGVCVDEYLTNEHEGVFKARLDCKRWGKKRNVLAYFTFEDGSKVMAAAWQNTGYLGIPEIEEGDVYKRQGYHHPFESSYCCSFAKF